MIFRLRQGVKMLVVVDDVGLRIGLFQAAKLKEIEWSNQNQERRNDQQQQGHADQVQYFSERPANWRWLLVGQSEAARGFFCLHEPLQLRMNFPCPQRLKRSSLNRKVALVCILH